jgi:hypothetical protein
MGKPSRARDLVGAVLLVLVGLLYMTGVSNLPVEHGADLGEAVDVMDVSAPMTVDSDLELEYRT